ncbi:MAG: tRNA pseudouridine(38-40) synthase TruA [Smithellaceae bacterium]|nr:tRNA pseudouridine(38-40) synthase TruA [Smithellaceae bacterium]
MTENEVPQTIIRPPLRRNLKIIVEYDGSAYQGWQNQGEKITIQGTLEGCLQRITQENIRVSGSGRTDAGVHALNQTANFLISRSIGVRQLLRAMNGLLPADIVVKSIEEVPLDFHARIHARSKNYLYRIYNSPLRPVVGRQYVWHFPHPLDLAAMEEAMGCLLGTHDFSAFCAAGSAVKDRTRTIIKTGMERDLAGLIEISLEATGFLRHMVRNIVGTLVEIGQGKRTAGEIPAILAGKDRRKAGRTAPACGLFLTEVRY